jgi:hypothetical protein
VVVQEELSELEGADRNPSECRSIAVTAKPTGRACLEMASLLLNSVLSRWMKPLAKNATAATSGDGGSTLLKAATVNLTANATAPISFQEALLLHSDRRPSIWTFLFSGYSVT